MRKGKRERERERRARTHTNKEAHGNAARQHSKHETIRRQSKRTLVYVYIYIYICRRFERLQPIRPARRIPTPDHSRTQKSKMEILPEAHGRSTEQSQPLENLRENSYGE